MNRIFVAVLIVIVNLLQVVTTLNILSTIANAMGSSCVKYVKVLMPGAMNVLSDSKVCAVYSTFCYDFNLILYYFVLLFTRNPLLVNYHIWQNIRGGKRLRFFTQPRMFTMNS